MLGLLARNWWALALRGVIAILFGFMAWIWPDLTVRALVLLFGAYALVDGVFAIVAAASGAGGRRWWALVIEGLLGIAVGLITMVWPDLTALALLYFIASWAIITGVLEIFAAFELRREIEGEWLLGLGGLASILFGLILIVFPGDGALALIWLIGAYAIFFGALLIGLAWRVRSMGDRQPPEIAVGA
ncbi:MAG: HdeD family acid-resistance protein [Chloroflexota bacterium]|nr:HdeD family acid-resistance protein [Chloroflexota bacterium]